MPPQQTTRTTPDLTLEELQQLASELQQVSGEERQEVLGLLTEMEREAITRLTPEPPRLTVSELQELANDPDLPEVLPFLDVQERQALEQLGAPLSLVRGLSQAEGIEATPAGLEGSRERGRNIGETVTNAARDFGLVETGAGLAGGAVAGTLGAMSAAALARMVRGAFEGETMQESRIPAVMEGGIEGVPFVGKFLRNMARTAIRVGVGPAITKEIAENFGRGALNPRVAGGRKMAEGIRDLPGGPRMTRVGDTTALRIRNISEELRPQREAAEAEGVALDPQRIVGEARERVLGPEGQIGGAIRSPSKRAGAEGVFSEFERDFSREVPLSEDELLEMVRGGGDVSTVGTTRREFTPITPTEAQNRLTRTKFEIGDPRESPGTDTALIALRSGLSRNLQEAVPATARGVREQGPLLAFRDVLEDAVAREEGIAGVTAPRLVGSGGGVRPFFILPTGRRTVFSGGRALNALGKPIESQLSPGVIRLLEGLLSERSSPGRREFEP